MSERLRVQTFERHPFLPRSLPLAPLLFLFLFLLAPGALGQRVVQPPVDATRELGIALRAIGVAGRALYVTAHPDDEDSRLLAWLGHGRGIDCTLLTLTRGEGGQNAIGPELFEALGVLRSEECRAARRYDGARQLFGRAFEFGYSFSVEETFAKWGREEMLRDLVRTVREVRPHVIFTMPAEAPVGGQHHQASALLAREAFEIAATKRWPELGRPHETRRLFEQVWGPEPEEGTVVTPPIDAFDPLIGATWRDLGFRARSMHKCQETGQVHDVGGDLRARSWLLVASRGPRLESGEDPFAGLAIHRDPRSGRLVSERPELFVAGRPDPSRPTECFRRLEALAARVHPKLRAEVEEAMARALPHLLEVRADTDRIGPGDTVALRLLLRNDGGLPFDEITVRTQPIWDEDDAAERPPLFSGPLRPGARIARTATLAVPREIRRVNALRLEKLATADRYPPEVSRHLPRNAAIEVAATVRVGEHLLELPRRTVVRRFTDPDFPAARERDLALLPDVELAFERSLLPWPVAPKTTPRDPVVTLSVRLEAPRPEGTRVEVLDPTGAVVFTRPLPESSTEFSVPLPLGAFDEAPERHRFRARLRRPDGRGEKAPAYRAVEYRHVRRAFLEVPASCVVHRFRSALPGGQRIGWVAGTGDATPDLLRRAGLHIQALEADDLLERDLDRFDVIVTGVRAYRVREDLHAATPRLRGWMEAGGHLVVLYNKIWEMNSGTGGRGGSPFTPFTARVSRARVTVEEAPVEVLLPDHPLLNHPNRIGPEDWEDWVQERGLYFLETKDPAFEDLIALADPYPLNADRHRGALTTAEVGSGRWTYVGLALFRQIPAGVPGGFRILANLLAHGSRRD